MAHVRIGRGLFLIVQGFVGDMGFCGKLLGGHRAYGHGPLLARDGGPTNLVPLISSRMRVGQLELNCQCRVLFFNTGPQVCKFGVQAVKPAS